MGKNDEHQKGGQKKGKFDKIESDGYRKNCLKCGHGYHGHRWDAHHILPGTVFTQATAADVDDCIKDSLDTTDYDINKPYSMIGLPKLTAYSLFYQKDTSMKQKGAREGTSTMRRWGRVRQYASDRARIGKKLTDPGNLPVLNPVSWGHTEYNKQVLNKLNAQIFNKLRKKKKQNQHFKPEDLKTQITAIKNKFRTDLKARGALPGIPGKIGVKANLQARHDANNQKWWIPLCMVDVPEPAS